MEPWKRLALAAGIALVLTAGCSGPGGSSGTQAGQTSQAAPQPSPTEPVIAPFEATVELSDFSATCREVSCWLPTQFAPKRVKGETVSLRDKWPMDDMTVLVLCEGGGESYQDQAGQESTAWYGILVPSDKLEPGADKRATKAPGRDGWIGYVGASWIKGGQDKQAPYC